jgi:hypothetical protein
VADVSGVGTHSSSRRLSTLARCQGRHAARREKFFFCCTIDCITAHPPLLRCERQEYSLAKLSSWSASSPTAQLSRPTLGLLDTCTNLSQADLPPSEALFARLAPLSPTKSRSKQAPYLRPRADCLPFAALLSTTLLDIVLSSYHMDGREATAHGGDEAATFGEGVTSLSAKLHRSGLVTHS